MSTNCDLCEAVRQPEHQAARAVGRLCLEHEGTLREVLCDIARWHDHLGETENLITTKDRDTERWVGSKAPCDTRALSVLDRRTRQLTKDDEVSPLRVVRAWAYGALDFHYGDRVVWSHDHPMPDEGIVGPVAVLLALLPVLAEHEDVLRFAQHMAAVRRQLTRMIPDF